MDEQKNLLKKQAKELDEDYMGTPLSSLSRTLVSYNVGDLVVGKVVHVEPDRAFVDLAQKAEAEVPLSEISIRKVNSCAEAVNTGEEIHAVVQEVQSQEGRLILSKRLADEQMAWDNYERAFKTKVVLSTKVNRAIKGGLLVEASGLRGFVPASHVDLKHVENLSEYVGKEVSVKVIGISRDEKKLVFSIKEALKELAEKKKEEMLANLQTGQDVEVTVTKLSPYGAFVEYEGMGGLLHISEMSWRRIHNPAEVVSVGEKLKVRVLRLDKKNKKLAFGLKQLLPDPWQEAEQRYPLGTLMEGTVMRVLNFGVFVALDEYLEGLVHVQEISEPPPVKIEESVKLGDKVWVKVVELNPQERRLGLSIRQAEEERRLKEHQDSQAGSQPTLGELFDFSSAKDSRREEEPEISSIQSQEADDAGNKTTNDSETPVPLTGTADQEEQEIQS